VSIFETDELPLFVRLFGYLWGFLAPVATMTACPTVVDWTNQAEAEAAQLCMKRGRSIEDADGGFDSSLFVEETIFIDRPEGGDPIRVMLFKKRNSESKAKAPLVLYIHGGGFTVRGSKLILSSLMLTALQNMDDINSPVMESATWATVDYRLAPEHVYPAAPEDCMLALNHLVHSMGLGEGGIHVAGSSAGGTLAMETALKFDLVDTFYVDQPMVPLSTNDGNNEWALDSPSFRRYSYSRMPPVTWLEWSLQAYTGMEISPDVEKDLYLGTIPTSVDITGGSMSVSEWVKRSENSTSLPQLILVTAKGDPLHDGGLAFKDVYEQAIREVEAKNIKQYDSATKEETSAVRHFDTNSGHVGFYFFEPAAFAEIMKEWHTEMRLVWDIKNSCANRRNEAQGLQEMKHGDICTDTSSVLKESL